MFTDFSEPLLHLKNKTINKNLPLFFPLPFFLFFFFAFDMKKEVLSPVFPLSIIQKYIIIRVWFEFWRQGHTFLLLSLFFLISFSAPSVLFLSLLYVILRSKRAASVSSSPDVDKSKPRKYIYVHTHTHTQMHFVTLTHSLILLSHANAFCAERHALFFFPILKNKHQTPFFMHFQLQSFLISNIQSFFSTDHPSFINPLFLSYSLFTSFYFTFLHFLTCFLISLALYSLSTFLCAFSTLTKSPITLNHLLKVM